jgi:hypothetical protein
VWAETRNTYKVLMVKTILIVGGERDVSLFHFLQTGSGAHPDSYQMGAADSFPGYKVVRV